MATHKQIRRSVDENLKALRNRASELRLLIWKHGAMADPRALMTGMDEIFESSVELETLIVRERMAASPRPIQPMEQDP
jgi:hypothetical protein